MPNVAHLRCPIPGCGGPLQSLDHTTRRRGRVVERIKRCQWCGFRTPTTERVERMPVESDLVDSAARRMARKKIRA
jgi:hypothetical protein